MIKIWKLALVMVAFVGIVVKGAPSNTSQNQTDAHNAIQNQSPKDDANTTKNSQADVDESQFSITNSNSAQNSDDSENNQKNSDEIQQNLTLVDSSQKETEIREESQKIGDENQKNSANLNSDSKKQLNNTNINLNNQTQQSVNQQSNNRQNSREKQEQSETYSIFDQYELFDLEDLFNQDFKDDHDYTAAKIKEINNQNNNQTSPKKNTSENQIKDNKSQKNDHMEKFLKDLYEENFDDLFEFQDYQYYGDYGYYSGYDFDGIFQNPKNLPDYDNNQYQQYDTYDLFKDTKEDVCYKNSAGDIVLNASMEICDVKLQGADKFQMSFSGGLDGVYKLSGCHNGRPKYIRYQPKGEERVLWWSKFFGDWDINAGTEPDSDNILCHGGQGHDEERPNFVSSSSWALSKLKKTNNTKNQQNPEKVFELIELNVTCSDGKSLNQPEFSKFGKQPLLTDEEMEYQYRMIYEKFSRQQPPEPKINGVLVIMVLFSGIGVLLGIPYLVVKRNKKQLNRNKNRNSRSATVNKFKEQIDIEKQRFRKL